MTQLLAVTKQNDHHLLCVIPCRRGKTIKEKRVDREGRGRAMQRAEGEKRKKKHQHTKKQKAVTKHARPLVLLLPYHGNQSESKVSHAITSEIAIFHVE